ncbi:MAG: phosphoglycerate mutase family protein [Planctomycetota bacterium]|nr:phosphoglycerate mutase family protein [Planctomycetota bacterium]
MCPLRCTYIRHAESRPDSNDHARPLTSAGEASAAALGVRLLSLLGTPDLIFSSNAKRARDTAGLLGLGQVSIQPELYLASADVLADFTRNLPPVEHVLIVAHNPGLSELLWRHHPRRPLSPASGFQLFWDVEDWLLTEIESPSGLHQFSASGGSDS